MTDRALEDRWVEAGFRSSGPVESECIVRRRQDVEYRAGPFIGKACDLAESMSERACGVQRP